MGLLLANPTLAGCEGRNRCACDCGGRGGVPCECTALPPQRLTAANWPPSDGDLADQRRQSASGCIRILLFFERRDDRRRRFLFFVSPYLALAFPFDMLGFLCQIT